MEDSSTDSQVVALKPRRMWQTTFQVTLPDARNKQSTYHARRAHRKSRNGCITCKKRRVKCDERKPRCQRCENYGSLCCYPPSPSANSALDFLLAPPSKMLFSLSVAEMVTKVRESLDGDLVFAPRMIGDPSAVLSIAVHSFQQFVNSSTDTVGALPIRNVMKTDMVHVAFNTSYLMYAMLGCGLLHLNRMSPGNQSRELAEAFFWQQAIKMYQRALQEKVTERNIDGLISACMLMGITSVIPPSFQPADSWVLTGRPSDMNWLALQGGLSCILSMAGGLLDRSIWHTAFSRSHDSESKLYQFDIEQGREGLHPVLADLCGIDETSTDATSPYYFALKILSPLLELEPNASNAGQTATWMGRLNPTYVSLLRARDPRALVLMAYWAGLMCSLSEWQPWVDRRVRQECIAICIYLERQGDPIIQPFLEYPATGCGYTLRKRG